MIKSNISNKWDERYHVPWHNALKTDTPGYSDQEKSLNLSLTGVGVCSQSALVAQLCPALCNPMDCSLPGSSVHGILQARILEWVDIPFPRGSSQPRDWTWGFCIVGRFFTIWAKGKVQNGTSLSHKKEWKIATCSNMDGPRDHHTKWNVTEKNKYSMTSLIRGI